MTSKHSLATPQSLTIPQEFILTILNDQTGYFHQVEGWNLSCAIIGAVLADLSLRARIDADEESLFLLDSTGTGDPILDTCLAEIASHPDPEKPRYWIEGLSVHAEDFIEETLNHLVELEILVRHEGEFFTTNHCAWHAELQQYPKSESVGDYIRSRTQKAIFTDIIPDPRDSFLIGLLNACDIIQSMFDLDENNEARIEIICKLELINRLLSTAVKQVIIAPSLQHSPLTKPIPKVALKHLLANPHLWDGNLPALFGNLADQYGPVFQIGMPFQRPRTFLAGPRANEWARRNSRRFLTSGHFFREMETICGANNLLPSMDGGDHFRLRKVMAKIYSKKRFNERLNDMVQLTREFVIDQNWQAGAELKVQRDTRLMTNYQMFKIFLSIDAQEEFEDLVKWNERAIMCYVAGFLPKFLARTPAMKRRFRLYEKIVQRIDQSHIPIQRTEVAWELADELISLHSSDPQFIPEQNLLFMLAATPVFQSIYLGDMLGFMLFEMARHPDIASQISEEAKVLFDDGNSNIDEFALEKCDVTRRFLMECLRIYPVITVNLRDVATSCVFENYSLPLRERIHIVQTAAHYMCDSFPDPYKFDIDRYLPPRNEHRKVGYAPYGSDTHKCAGQAWMRLHLAVTVLIVAYYYEFAPLPDDYKLKINPFPALSVSEKLRLRIASQRRELAP